ncbi:olfactory receptor 5V1-like [Bombina bombina]|uniref:olfactory receptor 5V1-like n=1 Tax=Bombina bombina TaxID=8345 RepID=UPI00235B2139|nr:olfactory receptor 5V1-like [Bombina bombina]
MAQTNHSMVSFFIITGISDVPKLQVPIFLLVLLIYFFTLGGNLTILLLVCLDRQLHTPMYFFLGNLSLLDMSCTTISLHKLLLSFISGDNTISHLACITQVYEFTSLTTDELLLLTAMSYDRYVAICNPLQYPMVMRNRVCLILAFACWVLGFVELSPYLVLLLDISCYSSNIINHFFCDIVPVMTLSCSDISVLKIVIFTEGILVLSLTPFMLTFISYVFIIATILRIRSSIGRRKAFYTCSSHLTIVVLLYISLYCQYLRPISKDMLASSKLFSLINTAAVPILNPLIYSLKNKDVKSALKRLINSNSIN